jgi:hypothetical protein
MDTLDPDIAAHIPRILETIAKLELGRSDLLNKETSPRSVANLEGKLAQLTTSGTPYERSGLNLRCNSTHPRIQRSAGADCMPPSCQKWRTSPSESDQQRQARPVATANCGKSEGQRIAATAPSPSRPRRGQGPFGLRGASPDDDRPTKAGKRPNRTP